MKARPFVIGLTGNIATGKSQVARLLARRGAHLVDADREAHKAMRPGSPAYGSIVETFGSDILAADGTIDRSKLGALVFRAPAALRRLEAIVHPAVIAETDRQIAAATRPVVIVEAIKLIEAGMQHGCDELWVVTAPRVVQIARLIRTRKLSEQEAALRVDAQPPQEEKAAQADQVIVNDGTLDQLRRKVEAAWGELQARLEASRLPSIPTGPEGRTETSSGQVPLCSCGVAIRAARRDDPRDWAGMATVLNHIVAEGRYTALAGPFTLETEQAYLQGLGGRSQVFVAEVARQIVGFQCLEPFVSYTPTMAHVAHLGTYVLAPFRGRGIGRKLAEANFQFATENGYEKAVVYVLADNEVGLAYYRSLGFEPRGTLRRQTKIGESYHDEVFMELHFQKPQA